MPTQASPSASSAHTVTIPVQLAGTSAGSPLVVHIASIPSATSPHPHWTTYGTAIATPIVAMVAAAIAAAIAYRQWKTAKQKLKFDLYQDRMKIYEAAMHFVDACWLEQDHVGADKALQEFSVARWLFGNDMVRNLRHLEEAGNLRLAANDHRANVMYDKPKAQIALMDAAAMRGTIQGWFEPYMHIEA